MPDTVDKKPLPCPLGRKDVPAIYGVSLAMTLAEAKKLYPTAKKTSPFRMPDGVPREFAPQMFDVPRRLLLKYDLGIALDPSRFGQAFGFTATEALSMDAISVRFYTMQKLTNQELFDKISTWFKIAPEMWLRRSDPKWGNDSWTYICDGFMAQFDAQKSIS